MVFPALSGAGYLRLRKGSSRLAQGLLKAASGKGRKRQVAGQKKRFGKQD
jgi:hypothetical protein